MDGIKVHIKGESALHLYNHPLLEFEIATSVNKGKLQSKQSYAKRTNITYETTTYIAYFQHLEFRFKETIAINTSNTKKIYNAEILGSIHKFAKGNNSGIFTRKDFIQTIEYFTKTFDINAEEIRVVNFEF